MPKRHGGIVTFGVVGIIFGLVGFLYNGFWMILVVVLKSGATGLDAATAEALKSVNVPILLSIALNMVTGVMVFVAGIALFSLKGWARVWYMVAASVAILNRLATFPLHFTSPTVTGANTVARVANQIGSVVGDLGVIAFNVAVLWFFNRATIKQRFHVSPAPPS